MRRYRFGKKSEQLTGVQGSLLEEAVDENIVAIEQELLQLQDQPVASAPMARQQDRRQRLPEDLPHVDIHHEPDQTQCSCGCQLHRIGQDISEKLDCQPGCMAHARRKFFDLQQANQSQLAEQARPIANALHAWALDYSLKR